MLFMDVLGYLGAVVIGVVLGLIGGGGSILTVPILVYILAINPVLATAYSLFVVGTTALVGAIKNIQKGLVDFRTAFVFSIPAFITVYLTRRYFLPILPDNISLFNIIITKDHFIMILFSVLMRQENISSVAYQQEIGSKGRPTTKFSRIFFL